MKRSSASRRFHLAAALCFAALSACAPARLATEPHALVAQTPAPRNEMTLDGALVRVGGEPDDFSAVESAVDTLLGEP